MQQHTATNSSMEPCLPHPLPSCPPPKLPTFPTFESPATSYQQLPTNHHQPPSVHQVSTMREKQASRKTMARESDIIDVDDSSSHSTDSAGSIQGAQWSIQSGSSRELHATTP